MLRRRCGQEEPVTVTRVAHLSSLGATLGQKRVQVTQKALDVETGGQTDHWLGGEIQAWLKGNIRLLPRSFGWIL